MSPETPLVPGEPAGSVAPATAPATGGVANPATATTTPADAEQKLQEYEQRLQAAEAARQQIETDLRNVKSSLQRRESALTNDFRAKEREYQREIEQIRTSSMDDDERKIYEDELRKQRLSELEDELNSIRVEKEQAQATTNAYIYFTRNGIDPNRLILDQGYDALYQSGMEAMANDLNKLRSTPSTPNTAAQPKEPPAAPPVVTTTNPPAGTKPTWAELVQKYGSEENVYSLVEQGRLPNSIIPS